MKTPNSTKRPEQATESEDGSSPSSSFDQIMVLAKQALFEGVRVAGDRIVATGDRVEHSGYKALGDFIESIGRAVGKVGKKDSSSAQSESKQSGEIAQKKSVTSPSTESAKASESHLNSQPKKSAAV